MNSAFFGGDLISALPDYRKRKTFRRVTRLRGRGDFVRGSVGILDFSNFAVLWLSLDFRAARLCKRYRIFVHAPACVATAVRCAVRIPKRFKLTILKRSLVFLREPAIQMKSKFRRVIVVRA